MGTNMDLDGRRLGILVTVPKGDDDAWCTLSRSVLFWAKRFVQLQPRRSREKRVFRGRGWLMTVTDSEGEEMGVGS